MTTPELAPPLQTSAPHRREDLWSPTYDLTCNRSQYTTDRQWNRVSNLEPSDGSSMESAFEPGAFRFQGRDLITRPPRLSIFYIITN
ncbi:hypothetical protein AVEN_209446-1 [Araneus ventricosus]|uniref:Uncharacterized protein n=1 Tax=Araneus ventricosus TaxID=182803 RepID=A0A4Y2UDC6_ARAVE|nr:hypothetical protein AVEN_209446-1 [Araneus ventricosus]